MTRSFMLLSAAVFMEANAPPGELSCYCLHLFFLPPSSRGRQRHSHRDSSGGGLPGGVDMWLRRRPAAPQWFLQPWVSLSFFSDFSSLPQSCDMDFTVLVIRDNDWEINVTFTCMSFFFFLPPPRDPLWLVRQQDTEEGKSSVIALTLMWTNAG